MSFAVVEYNILRLVLLWSDKLKTLDFLSMIMTLFIIINKPGNTVDNYVYFSLLGGLEPGVI